MNKSKANNTNPGSFEAEVFRFGSYEYDPSTGSISLGYQFDSGPKLMETLVFPHAPWPPEPSRQAAFVRALRLLHLVAGVSYYKAAIPAKIEFQNGAPAGKLADFTRTLYVEGLAEFSFVNQVDVASRFRFDPAEMEEPPGLDLLLPDRALVAMGGGKDSLVGLDILLASGVDVTPVCIGSSELIGETVAATGLPLLRITRHLAPELKAMNENGALNGHVPVTAINSAILLCAAILYGYRYVVFSNERSADEASLLNSEGVAINHQYSKSSIFEADFRELVGTLVSPDIDYFSILRPFSELDIVRRFCQLKKFRSVYSSCNRNFHLEGSRNTGRWCRDCPKCRFAALSLAVFLSPEELIEIQGENMLNNIQQLDGFLALCGLERDKPFECVGETEESRAAMLALTQMPQWQNLAVVKAVKDTLGNRDVTPLEDLLKPSKRHFIPASLLASFPSDIRDAL